VHPDYLGHQLFQELNEKKNKYINEIFLSKYLLPGRPRVPGTPISPQKPGGVPPKTIIMYLILNKYNQKYLFLLFDLEDQLILEDH
jgi:hypothetical protein